MVWTFTLRKNDCPRLGRLMVLMLIFLAASSNNLRELDAAVFPVGSGMKRIEIRTERLLLRSYRLEDVDDVFAYARDPEWSRYLERLPYPEPYIREHAEKFVARRVLAASRIIHGTS